jgi:hypothetical protein
LNEACRDGRRGAWGRRKELFSFRAVAVEVDDRVGDEGGRATRTEVEDAASRVVGDGAVREVGRGDPLRIDRMQAGIAGHDALKAGQGRVGDRARRRDGPERGEVVSHDARRECDLGVAGVDCRATIQANGPIGIASRDGQTIDDRERREVRRQDDMKRIVREARGADLAAENRRKGKDVPFGDECLGACKPAQQMDPILEDERLGPGRAGGGAVKTFGNPDLIAGGRRGEGILKALEGGGPAPAVLQCGRQHLVGTDEDHIRRRTAGDEKRCGGDSEEGERTDEWVCSGRHGTPLAPRTTRRDQRNRGRPLDRPVRLTRGRLSPEPQKNGKVLAVDHPVVVEVGLAE